MATVASGLNSGSGFNSSDTITSTTLNNHVNNATVTGIVNADVASNAAVAVTKLATITSQNVLGNIGSGNASVPIVGATGLLLDEDDLSTNSDTKGATQQSIKAYVDALRPNIVNVVKTDAEEITISTENTYVDIPTMEKAITTKKADSTFIVSAMLNFGFTDTDKEFAVKCQYKVGSGSYTDFNLADSAGSSERCHLQVQQSRDDASYIENFQLIVPLVDPAYTVGDVLTFKLLVAGVNTTNNIFINKGQSTSTTNDNTRTISTLTVQEV